MANSSKNDGTVGAKPRIAIPEPCSYDAEYSDRALPPYLRAVEAAGGEPVVIPLQKFTGRDCADYHLVRCNPVAWKQG